MNNNYEVNNKVLNYTESKRNGEIILIELSESAKTILSDAGWMNPEESKRLQELIGDYGVTNNSK